MKNSNDTSCDRTSDLPICSTAPKPLCYRGLTKQVPFVIKIIHAFFFLGVSVPSLASVLAINISHSSYMFFPCYLMRACAMSLFAPFELWQLSGHLYIHTFVVKSLCFMNCTLCVCSTHLYMCTLYFVLVCLCHSIWYLDQACFEISSKKDKHMSDKRKSWLAANQLASQEGLYTME